MGDTERLLGSSDDVDWDDEQRKATVRKWLLIGGCVLGVLLIVAIVSVVIVLDIKGKHSGDELANSVTMPNIQRHLVAFQAAANTTSPPNRASGPGYNASAQYVINMLPSGFYNISTQSFLVPNYTEVTPAALAVVDANNNVINVLVRNTDFASVRYSASGNFSLTAAQVVELPPASFGCISTDFPPSVAGKVVLLPAVTANCTFAVKVLNAQQAGAIGLLYYGSTLASRSVFDDNTWNTPAGILPTLPVLSLTSTAAEVVRMTGFVTMSGDSTVVLVVTYNVIAETKTGDPSTVLIQGSQLDSVQAGPGINDNASGSAMNLEIAIQYANLQLESKYRIRFAWWAAEELGLIGSSYYVSQLSLQERQNIALYLNYDMVGSSNYVIQIYNATTAPLAYNGSLALQQLFERGFNNSGMSYTYTPMNGGSDYYPFIQVGIPANGLATGARGIKTYVQSQQFGGLYGASYDPCYHLPCDDINNISQECMSLTSQSAASVWQQLTQMEDVRVFLGNTTIIGPTVIARQQ